MSTQSSRERLLAIINHQVPDRVPVAPFVIPRMVKNMSKEEWSQLLYLTDITMMTNVGGDIYLGEETLNRVKKSRNNEIITVKIHTPKGILIQKIREDRDSSWLIDPLFKSQEDIKRFLSVPYKCSQINADDYFQWEKRIGNEGLVRVGIPSAMRFPFSYFGSEHFYLMIAEDLDLVEELTKIAMYRIKEYIEKCCKIGIQHFWMGGSEHCGPGVVNPKIFERLVVPYDKQIVKLIHKYNGFVYYHIHGKLRGILDSIVEIGADIVGPLEKPPGGDISLKEIKEKIGNRICLQGNIDDMKFIAYSSKEEIEKMVFDCIKDAGEGGGYILSGTDAGIYWPKWVENFLVMAKVAGAYLYKDGDISPHISKKLLIKDQAEYPVL